MRGLSARRDAPTLVSKMQLLSAGAMPPGAPGGVEGFSGGVSVISAFLTKVSSPRWRLSLTAEDVGLTQHLAHSKNPGGCGRMTTGWEMVILPKPTILLGVRVEVLVGAAWNMKPGALI